MFRLLLYPFLVYRSFALPVLVLSSIVVPCWLIRAYRRRISAHPPPLRREILLLTFVLYLAGLAAVTLTTNHNSGLWNEIAALEIGPTLAS